jgi:hypothetical protein
MIQEHHLYGPESSDLASPWFYVAAGWRGALRAFGFQPRPVFVQEGKPKASPMACLKMVWPTYYSDSDELRMEHPCGVFRTVSAPVVASSREEYVYSHGCPWALSACNNFALIDVPGIYRLVLNDPSLLGIVDIRLSVLSAGQLDRASGLFFGE